LVGFGVRRLDDALDDAARRVAFSEAGRQAGPSKSGVKPPHSISTGSEGCIIPDMCSFANEGLAMRNDER
jgi:hypothetical protein